MGWGGYEPDTLTGVQNSIDRHLKDLKIHVDIKKDETFSHSRRVLEAKRKELKGQGKGNKKNKAEPLDSDDIQKMYEKQVLGAGMFGIYKNFKVPNVKILFTKVNNILVIIRIENLR